MNHTTKATKVLPGQVYGMPTNLHLVRSVPTLGDLGRMIQEHFYHSARPLREENLRWVMSSKTEFNIANNIMRLGYNTHRCDEGTSYLLNVQVLYDNRLEENEVQLYVNTQAR